jgi:hypothetical protein
VASTIAADGVRVAEVGEARRAPALGSSPRLRAGDGARGVFDVDLARSRRGSLVALIFFTVVWDGIVGTIVGVMWHQGKLGEDGCATLFLVPFALVGLALLAAIPYSFLATLNPRPLLSVSRPLAPGVAATLGWRFHGAAGRIRRLQVLLEGREEATYRRGTSSTTVRSVFLTLPLVDTSDALQIAAGTVALSLPGDAMHSFAAPHNAVVWSLRVKGEIARWPDIDDVAEILVSPAERWA